MAKSALFCRSENRASAAITFTRCWRGREGGTEGEKGEERVKEGRRGEREERKEGRRGEGEGGTEERRGGESRNATLRQ